MPVITYLSNNRTPSPATPYKDCYEEWSRDSTNKTLTVYHDTFPKKGQLTTRVVLCAWCVCKSICLIRGYVFYCGAKALADNFSTENLNGIVRSLLAGLGWPVRRAGPALTPRDVFHSGLPSQSLIWPCVTLASRRQRPIIR